MHNLNATRARVSRDSHDRSILKARLVNRTKWARDHVARRVMRLLLRYVNALHNLRVSVYIPMTPPIDPNTRFSSSCFRSTVIRFGIRRPLLPRWTTVIRWKYFVSKNIIRARNLREINKFSLGDVGYLINAHFVCDKRTLCG